MLSSDPKLECDILLGRIDKMKNERRSSRNKLSKTHRGFDSKNLAESAIIAFRDALKTNAPEA